MLPCVGQLSRGRPDSWQVVQGADAIAAASTQQSPTLVGNKLSGRREAHCAASPIAIPRLSVPGARGRMAPVGASACAREAVLSCASRPQGTCPKTQATLPLYSPLPTLTGPVNAEGVAALRRGAQWGVWRASCTRCIGSGLAAWLAGALAGRQRLQHHRQHPHSPDLDCLGSRPPGVALPGLLTNPGA